MPLLCVILKIKKWLYPVLQRLIKYRSSLLAALLETESLAFLKVILTGSVEYFAHY